MKDSKKDTFEQYKDKIKKVIRKQRGAFVGKELILFGVSEPNLVAMNELRKTGFQVTCVIDNSPRWKHAKWMRTEVISPDELIVTERTFVISCAVVSYDRVCQLMDKGISKDNMLFILPKQETFLSKLVVLKKAWACYRNISMLYGKKLILCPYPGTGDAFLSGRYLHNLINRLNWDEYNILVVGNSFKKVMELYGYDNCHVISKVECDYLKRLVGYFGYEKTGIYYLLYWGLPNQYLSKIETLTDFHTLFRQSIFHGCEKNPKRIEFDYNQDRSNDYMIKSGLKMKRTVILIPYANSFDEELEIEWWEKLVKKIQTIGYTVATNCGGDKEREIPGTVRLELSYDEFPEVAKACGYMIGVRCGFFDLMSEIDCKKIILYQNYIGDKRMRFFSLSNMGLCDDVVELKTSLSEQGMEKLIEDIVDRLLKER